MKLGRGSDIVGWGAWLGHYLHYDLRRCFKMGKTSDLVWVSVYGRGMLQDHKLTGQQKRGFDAGQSWHGMQFQAAKAAQALERQALVSELRAR